MNQKPFKLSDEEIILVEDENLLVSKIINKSTNMTWCWWATVEITIVLWEHINVMKYNTADIQTFSQAKCCIHYSAFVKQIITILKNQRIQIMEFHFNEKNKKLIC